MSFRILSAETRLARMVTWLGGIQTKITDFIPGGKTRTKLEAVAVEMEAQDLAFYQAAKKAIATAVYEAFGFSLLPGVAATGEALFARSTVAPSDIVVPLGTIIATVPTDDTPEQTYVTTAQGAIAEGEVSVALPIRAVTPGKIGNTGSGTITQIKTTISGVETVTNAASLGNGVDAESEEARRRRFVEYVTTLPRATAAGVVRGAKTAALLDTDGTILEQVASALVGEPRVGEVYVYIYNGTGTTSAELVTEAQRIIDGYTESDGTKVPGFKAAGVHCVVLAADETAIDVTAVVTVTAGYDTETVVAAVAVTAAAYLSALTVGETFVYHELVERMMGVQGVADIAISEPLVNAAAEAIVAVTFTGSGLDDATSGGAYTGAGRTDWTVEIDATGTPDTFRWSDDGGQNWTDGVAITGAAQVLSDGATITFGATTGHTFGDAWTFHGHHGVVFKPGTVAVT